MTRLERAVDLDLAVDRPAERGRRAEGQQELADEDDEQPALDAHPGRSQRRSLMRRSSSRWNTPTVPRSASRSQAASASATTIERW